MCKGNVEKLREKLRANMVSCMKSLASTFVMRGVELQQVAVELKPMNDFTVELQQVAVAHEVKDIRLGGTLKAKPKLEPVPPSSAHFYPSSAHFYLNQHVECSNDGMNWWDASITRIEPAEHVLELHVWNNGVRGWRFVRPLDTERFTNDLGTGSV